MAEMKAITLRLPGWLAEDLDTVAMVDQQPKADIVRDAITSYIQRRSEQPDWPTKTAAVIDRMRRLTEET